MRQKGEAASLAERLNNALAQQHAQKIAFEAEKAELLGQLERAREETERLRGKNRQLRRGKEEEGVENDGQQALVKINHYLTRLQQSAKQMAQVANECRVFDAQIQRASALIQRNILKSASGLQKYTQELVKQWAHRETLRLQNERLEKENKHLFELTTKLQQNFKDTDRLLKQLGRANGGEVREYAQEVRGRIARLEEQTGGRQSELEEKIARLGEKVRSLEQQNATIKNIHTRTMKKLEKLEQRNRDKEQIAPQGEGIQEERRMWLQKTQQMYQQVRRLTKELMLAEQSQRKVRQELAGVLEIYSQWQTQREDRKIQFQKLKAGLETYLQKIGQLQAALSERRGQVEAMAQRLQVSQGEKEKIVSVYQLEVQELNDLLFKKQDALTEIDALLTREHSRLEELKKQHNQLNKITQNLQENNKKASSEISQLRQKIKAQQLTQQKLKETISQSEQKEKQLKATFQKEKNQLLAQIQRHLQQKQEQALVVQEYKEQYYTVKKEAVQLQEQAQNIRDQHFSVKQELRNMLAISNDTIDIWTLLAQTRDCLKALVTENRSLKDSQRNLLEQMEGKNIQTAKQLEEISLAYETAKQGWENQRKNEEFSLKILKMKIIERQICKQSTLRRVNSMKELVEHITNTLEIKQNPSLQSSAQQVIQALNEKILILEQRQQKYKSELQKTVQQAQKATENIDLLQRIQKQTHQACQDAQLNLKEVLSQLKQQKQINEQLMKEIDNLKNERQVTNKEMFGLASELNKIQNQMEDFQDEKVSIQSKLEHAKNVHLKNEQLQRNNRQLQLMLQKMDEMIQNLQSTNQQLNEKKQILQRENQSFRIHLSESQKLNEINQNIQMNEVKLQNQKQSIQQRELKEKDEQHYLEHISNLLQENTELQANLTLKIAQIDELHNSLTLMTQNQALQNSKMQVLQQQLQNQHIQLLKREEQLRGKIGQVEQYRSICLKFEKEKDNLIALRQQLQAERQQAHQQSIQDNQQYIQLTLDNQASMHQIDHLEGLVKRLEKQLHEKDHIILSLNVDLQKIIANNTAIQAEKADMIAREEQLKISLARIHQKQVEMQKETIEIQSQRSKLNHAANEQEERCIKRQLQLNQRQNIINERENQIQKREEDLKIHEKETGFEHSHLGMQSLRQSKDITQEVVAEQLKEELTKANQIIRQKQFNYALKQAELDELLFQQKQNNMKFQRLQKEVSQLQQELIQYREHTEQLKLTVEQLNHQKQNLQIQFKQLEKEKDALQLYLAQFQGQIQYNTNQNHLLTQKYQQQKQNLNMEIDNLKDAIGKLQTVSQQQESTIKSLSSFLNEKQEHIQSIQSQLLEKQRLLLKSLAQINIIRAQNQQLLMEIDQANRKFAHAQKEAATATLQSHQYAARLEEIQGLMEALRKEEADSELLREKLQETLSEKQKLEDIVANMENNFAISTSNIALFQKRNQEITQQLYSCRQQEEVLKANADIANREIERITQSLTVCKKALKRYEQLGSVDNLSRQIDRDFQLQHQLDQLRERDGQLKKNCSIFQAKIQGLERQLAKTNDQTECRGAEVIKLRQQCRQLKENAKIISLLEDQNNRKMSKIQQIQQDLDQCKEDLHEREAKISELKEILSREVTQRQLLENQLREKTLDWQNAQQQAEHYRQQVKRIGKEKAQARGDVIKSKHSLQQQQRIKEQEFQELKRHSSQKQQIIRHMKQQIDSLRQQNSILQEQSQLDVHTRPSRGNSRTEFAQDMPLQMPSRTRQKSSAQERPPERIEWEIEDSRGQERSEKLSMQLRESERTNFSLNSEVQALRGQLRGRQATLDSLQRQFKTKSEDYSKLQRIVQSLRDQLNLQRKRVKNFEDLYQSIQQKRIKISQPKVTE